ncbi:hypothetical protein F2Q68_00008073 [Brassica cretica]|uniref:Phospholipase D C-terminal domain-containing protein n=1 Tax=Brassica cretica TaxID=69181 RepID=A0A8S9L384_BRACR|nr:hypothetical protein F2Q68_00008073 [Brassica cretica]
MRVRRGFAGDGSSRMVGIAVKGREIAERIEREAEAEITKKEEEGKLLTDLRRLSDEIPTDVKQSVGIPSVFSNLKRLYNGHIYLSATVTWLKFTNRLRFASTTIFITSFPMKEIAYGHPTIFRRNSDGCKTVRRNTVGVSEASSSNENDPETLHAQVFRSIDSSSVKGFPKDPKEASGRNLLCGKNILIDMSIHAAYVKAIRSAQHFIYIVNQYFLGSSFNWDSNKDLGANNLIPIEMALKIANKIRAREKFAAYIVIPMWPEAQNHANDVSNHPQGTCGSWT